MSYMFAAFADESDNCLEGQIDALVRNGYQYLEIRNLNGKNFTELTVEEAKEINKRLKEYDLGVLSLGSPIGKIQIQDDFQKHLELYRHTLELATVFGAKYIRLFSFYMPMDKDLTPYRDTVIERMGVLASMAKEYGVVACHENEKGIYGDTALRCLELHKAVPDLRAVFDPANFVQSGQDTLVAWDMLESYVEYMHIKDSMQDGRIVAPGMGAGNISTLLSKYKSIGGGLLTLEPHLYEFAGLKQLEREGEESIVGEMAFSSAEEAFDFAANSLKDLIRK